MILFIAKMTTDIFANRSFLYDQLENESRGQPIGMRWHFLLLSSIIFIVVCGNGVVVATVMLDRKLRSLTTNKFIASLAISDLLVGVLVMPFAVYIKVHNNSWGLGEVWCRLHLISSVFATTASIIHLVAISFDRYFAIVFPTEYQRHSVRTSASPYLVGIWLTSFVISSTLALQRSGVITLDPGDGGLHQQGLMICWILDPQFLILSSLLSFVLPGCIVVYVYGKIFRRLKRHRLFIFGLGAGGRNAQGPGGTRDTNQLGRLIPQVIVEEVRSRRGSRMESQSPQSGASRRNSSSVGAASLLTNPTPSNVSAPPPPTAVCQKTSCPEGPTASDVAAIDPPEHRARSPTICTDSIQHTREKVAREPIEIVPDPPSVFIPADGDDAADDAPGVRVETDHKRRFAKARRHFLQWHTKTRAMSSSTSAKEVAVNRRSSLWGVSSESALPPQTDNATLTPARHLGGSPADAAPTNTLATKHPLINRATSPSLTEAPAASKSIRHTSSYGQQPQTKRPPKTILRPAQLDGGRHLSSPTSPQTPGRFLSVTPTPPQTPGGFLSVTPTPPAATLTPNGSFFSLNVPKSLVLNENTESRRPSSNPSTMASSNSSYDSSDTMANYYDDEDGRRRSTFSSVTDSSHDSNNSTRRSSTNPAAQRHAKHRPLSNAFSHESKRHRLRQLAGQVTRAIRRKRKESMAIRQETKATRVVAAIIIAFLVCWLPYFCLAVYRGVRLGIEEAPSNSRTNLPSNSRTNSNSRGSSSATEVRLYLLCSWFGYIHSCVNPIIYTCLNRSFRHSLRRLLGCRGTRAGRRPQANSSSHWWTVWAVGLAGLISVRCARLSAGLSAHH